MTSVSRVSVFVCVGGGAEMLTPGSAMLAKSTDDTSRIKCLLNVWLRLSRCQHWWDMLLLQPGAGSIPDAREGIQRHALLQVRPIWDPKTAAAMHVTKTAGVHTSHGGKTSAGRVSGGTPMLVENMERRALMSATQVESVTAVQNVGRRLLKDTVFIATNWHIQERSVTDVMTVGNRLLAEII